MQPNTSDLKVSSTVYEAEKHTTGGTAINNYSIQCSAALASASKTLQGLAQGAEERQRATRASALGDSKGGVRQQERLLPPQRAFSEVMRRENQSRCHARHGQSPSIHAAFYVPSCSIYVGADSNVRKRVRQSNWHAAETHIDSRRRSLLIKLVI